MTLKFIYSEKATKFYKISTLLLSCVVPVESKVEILQNFVAFSEYTNFIYLIFNNSYVLENSRAGIASNALPIQMARMVPITIYLEVLLFKGQTIALYLKYI